MEVRLLGTLELIDDDGRPVPVAGAKLRALLAALALRPGQVVSADRLVEELWGPDARSTAANSLQALVSKLRRVLPGGMVVTRPPGYLLDVAPDTVDVGRFERLVSEGRKALAAGDVMTATTTLGGALALWRGPALAEFEYEEFARSAIARLEEERLAAFEDRVEADLASARHADLVAELEAAVVAEPLRERLRAQLMLALYRSGRQAEALRQFQEARRVLGEELGLEPGAQLRRLEAAMLAQDPALEAAAHDRPAAKPALPTPRRRRSNLRAPLTPTIGRQAELADLRAVVVANRLVTVVGPGGIGKTRLVVETARSLENAMEDGVWFVDLAPLSDTSGVVPAITTALEVPDLVGYGAGREGMLNRLADFLCAKGAALVLDNCEHLVGEVARVTEMLLSSCPTLRILATSREGLGVPGERLWPAPPLSSEAAVALFAERARAVHPTFALAGETEAVVGDICARVDRLPLAVELAAARVRAFPVRQIAARLDDRFRLLTGGARTALARQQSLRAVVDWSYDLLFADEQRLFERLSVFVGGFDLQAAVEVCTDELVAATEIPELVARLVDKSVVVVDSSGTEARFSMLQTLAQYGRERLTAAGQSAAFHTRHCHYFADIGRRSYQAFKGNGQREWIRLVTIELDNLRAALDWASQTDDADAALTIASGLAWYWQNHGHASEGLRWLDVAFACQSDDTTPEARCHATAWRSILSVQAGLPDPGPSADDVLAVAQQAEEPELVAWMRMLLAEVALGRGDIGRALELHRAARRYYATAEDPFDAGIVVFIDANTALLTGDNESAERQFAVGLQLSVEAGALLSGVLCLEQLSNLAESRGDYGRAASALVEATRTTAEMGFRGREVSSLVRLANLAELAGDRVRAQAVYGEADRLAAETASQPLLAQTLRGLALRHRHAGRLDQAADAARRALALYRNVDFVPGVVGSLCTLGFIAESRGDAAGAERHHREALAESRRTTDQRAPALCLEGLAGVALLAHEWTRSAALLGAARRHRQAPGLPPDALAQMVGTIRGWSAGTLDDVLDAERIESAVREQLGTEVFEAAYRAGAQAAVEDLAGC